MNDYEIQKIRDTAFCSGYNTAVSKYENKNAELEKENAELKAQIEKMINEIDKTMVLSNMRECEICDIHDIFRKYGFKSNTNDIWEIKEKCKK